MSFFDNEIAYLSAFCNAKPFPHGVRLHDARMPDMYSHNLTCVRDELSAGALDALVSAETAHRRTQGGDFLNLTLHFPRSAHGWTRCRRAASTPATAATACTPCRALPAATAKSRR